ncbi:DUF4240 domain-containing protein [Brachybacterium paraconglomeratum]|uniref:DUF4240 domain-containing protein n=1 Tax=Brachybacterium paraconglomeratum TaxID=173362 RepID=UPI0022E5EF88|nr:DUF4240 domain-containing protein [Brachybacterium paraconglomeratum]
MNDITFWNLLDEARTGREVDLEILRAALRGLSDSDLGGFDKKLRGKVKRLSSRAVRKALMANPELFDGEGWSDDGFEYVCAGIVALGEEVYKSVLRDPSVLSAGTWEEREELQYVAEEVLEERYGDDQDYPQGPLRWQASVSSEKYPVARAKPLEKGFPVATFSWLQVDVQDTSGMPERIYEYPDGEVFAYPPHAVLFDYFAGAAHEAQEALRAHIDFRKLPDLSLSMLVTVGESDTSPQWQLMPNFTHEELSPGIASSLSRERVTKLSPSETTALARGVIVDSLEMYFDGHPAEQRHVSELRQRLQ